MRGSEHCPVKCFKGRRAYWCAFLALPQWRGWADFVSLQALTQLSAPAIWYCINVLHLGLLTYHAVRRSWCYCKMCCLFMSVCVFWFFFSLLLSAIQDRFWNCSPFHLLLLLQDGFSVWEPISAGGSMALWMSYPWIYFFFFRLGETRYLLTSMASFKACCLEGVECVWGFEFLGAPVTFIQLMHGCAFAVQ